MASDDSREILPSDTDGEIPLLQDALKEDTHPLSSDKDDSRLESEWVFIYHKDLPEKRKTAEEEYIFPPQGWTREDCGRFIRSYFYFTRFGNNFQKNGICVAGRSRSYVDATVKVIRDLEIDDVAVSHRYITCSPQCSCSDENFEGAHFIILVATAESRMLLVSDVEESQLGNVYRRAKSIGAAILVLLAGHQESHDMTDSKLYEPSLKELCANQQAIGHLAAEDRFISRGFTYNPELLTLNKKQQEQIQRWLSASHYVNKVFSS